MVTSARFPCVEVRFTVRGIRMQAWAYLDTGFDGFLIVPFDTASALGDPDLVSTWELGDGSIAAGPDYLADIEVIGIPKTIRGQVTCLGDDWILGLGVLNNFETTFRHGREVEIRA